MTEQENFPLTSEELDDRIAAWHNGDGADQELHEFLGLTWKEYRCWVETGEINV